MTADAAASRRHLLATAGLAGAAAVTTAAAAPTPAAAQIAQAPATGGGQAPGFYRFRLGSLTALTVHDGFAQRPDARQGFVRNATPEQVEAALRDAFLPVDSFRIPYTVTFLETPRGVVAFDTGTGGQLGATAGRLHDNLRAAGVAPERVTDIVFTHFHPDHVTGLTTAEGAAVWPNAALHVPAPEWAFWTDEARANTAPEAMRPAFANVRRRFAPYGEARVRRFEPGAEVLPGVRSVATHGHTPGHTSYVVADGADLLLVLGDVTNRPELFVRNPGWHVVFDMDAAAAEATRRRVFDTAAAERMLVAGYHWPFPALGRVARDGEGYRMVPADWSGAV